MMVVDCVYGEVNLDSTAEAIVATPEFQRLYGVDQAGYLFPFYPEYVHSRAVHCIGVYAVLKTLRASEEEQIAGLLHDVSHTAFSHCTEYALAGNRDVTRQAYQDEQHQDHITQGHIARLLIAAGYQPDRVANEHNFGLLEQPAPLICADRFDYALRDAVTVGHISPAESLAIFRDLGVMDGKMVFSGIATARRFAELYRFMNEKYWSGIESAVMFCSVGGLLRRAVTLGLISEADFVDTDQGLLNKLLPYIRGDPQLQKYWRRMNNQVKYSNNPGDYEVEIPVKSRVVDPLCNFRGELVPMSQTLSNGDWQEVAIESAEPKIYYLKFED